jgi:beta-phosphoglucomutase-like phosphatase (HAD superfamily)
MNSPPTLVIFDCDGVLVDSEIISNRVFAECFAELGIVLTLEETMKFWDRQEFDHTGRKVVDDEAVSGWRSISAAPASGTKFESRCP